MARGRDNEPPMPEPLAYFLTWPTYGTWLPGDERGWIQHGSGWQLPDAVRKLETEAIMSEDACRLDGEQRVVVERQIAETCRRSRLEIARRQLPVEPILTRSVSEGGIRENWWAERGSQRSINDSESLEAAILYVRDGQDKPRGL